MLLLPFVKFCLSTFLGIFDFIFERKNIKHVDWKTTKKNKRNKVKTGTHCKTMIEKKGWLKNVAVVVSLFTKLPCSGDSDWIFAVFEPSCQQPICLPHDSGFKLSLFIAERQVFIFFGLTRPEIEPYRFSSRCSIHSTTDLFFFGIDNNVFLQLLPFLYCCQCKRFCNRTVLLWRRCLKFMRIVVLITCSRF